MMVVRVIAIVIQQKTAVHMAKYTAALMRSCNAGTARGVRVAAAGSANPSQQLHRPSAGLDP